MKLHIAGGLALAAALSAAPASAEVFSGPFVGLQGGWDHKSAGSPSSDLGALSVDQSKDSFTGGILAGYDYKIGTHVVIGVEGAFSLSTNDTLSRAARDLRATIDPKHSFDLSARAGYLVRPTTLVYVRGGYDDVRAKVSVLDNSTITSGKDDFNGWLAGAGVEQAISDSLAVRVEYRHSDLSGNGKFDRDQVLVGLSLHL